MVDLGYRPHLQGTFATAIRRTVAAGIEYPHPRATIAVIGTLPMLE